MENLIQTYNQEDLQQLCADLAKNQYTSFKTTLKRSDFQTFIGQFKDVIHTIPLTKLTTLNLWDRPGERKKAEAGWLLREPVPGKDHKLVMHYNDNYEEKFRHVWKQPPEVLVEFHKTAKEIYEEVHRLSHNFFTLLEEWGFDNIKNHFYKDGRLALARLRIINYLPHKAALMSLDEHHVYRAAPHYDDSGLTLGMFEDSEGLRIGTEEHLESVFYQEGRVLGFMAVHFADFLREYYGEQMMELATLLEIPEKKLFPKAYHDVVVPVADSYDERISVVSFIGSDAIPEARSNEVHRST